MKFDQLAGRCSCFSTVMLCRQWNCESGWVIYWLSDSLAVASDYELVDFRAENVIRGSMLPVHWSLTPTATAQRHGNGLSSRATRCRVIVPHDFKDWAWGFSSFSRDYREVLWYHKGFKTPRLCFGERKLEGHLLCDFCLFGLLRSVQKPVPASPVYSAISQRNMCLIIWCLWGWD